MDELFGSAPRKKDDKSTDASAPLADRIRPRSINEIAGQRHLVGENGPLRAIIESGDVNSMIFWGPPGTGKTTLAYIIADSVNYDFTRLSAVESGVKDVRQVISNAEKLRRGGRRTLLFIDEIHRFNKSQQDALLHAVEKGIITLIGATTENPSFEINSALLSRCQVYRLHSLSDEDILNLVKSALKNDILLGKFEIEITDTEFLLAISGGDARTALNALDLAIKISRPVEGQKVIIDRKLLEKALQQKTAQYDKHGEAHYDTISAFIKSMRGSDPDAALLWLAKMLEAGEDPKFIARRMVIFASEDIGNADPRALQIAVSVFDAVNLIGMPECRINLSHGVTYLASAPKSNAAYMGVEYASSAIKRGISLSVPLKLRNAPTELMKKEGYHKGYQYPHSFSGNFIKEKYFPDDAEVEAFYKPGINGDEKAIKERLEKLWPERYCKDSRD
ncbi:MAG: replication-associated recombination protein A [Candidatus Kapaibacterium sp.]